MSSDDSTTQQDTPETETPNLPAGWGWPILAKKAHWFDEGEYQSRCNQWAFSGLREGLWSSNSPDDCGRCRQSLTASPPSP